MNDASTQARDDFPCLREGAGLDEWDELYGRMCDEVDRLREVVLRLEDRIDQEFGVSTDPVVPSEAYPPTKDNA